MQVGIVGLGLMGGSAARQYSLAGAQVYAYNRTREKVDSAISKGLVKGYLTPEVISSCDLIILSLPLKYSILYLNENAHLFKNYVVDFCGVKTEICKAGNLLSSKYGFTFFGTHPMCGTNKSGFENSLDNLYTGSAMVVALDDEKIKSSPKLQTLLELLKPLDFAKFVYCTSKEHDKIIALTSQMAHCITSSFVKSPTAKNTCGIKAGGFRDMSRLASLVPSMWADLFIANSENLTNELDIFISNISALRDAIAQKDEQKILDLLSAGAFAKKEIEEAEKCEKQE